MAPIRRNLSLPFCPSCGREIAGDALFCPHCGRNLRESSPNQFAQMFPDPDASTAKTVTLIAIILQIVFFVLGLAIVGFFLFLVGVPFTFTSTGPTGIPPPNAGFALYSLFSIVFGIAFLISALWIALDYYLIYRNLNSPNTIPSAKTPSLILGIVQLIFGGVIPGILLIVAYIKIGDSMQKRGQF